MKFHTYFKRRKGASPASIAEIGTADPAPTFASPTTTNKDNVLHAKVGGVGNAIQRVAVGYLYEGGGSGVDLPATMYVFDKATEKWFKTETDTLKAGELTFFRVPYLADPPQTDLKNASSGGADYMIVIPDPGGLSDGTYHFVMGPDIGQF